MQQEMQDKAQSNENTTTVNEIPWIIFKTGDSYFAVLSADVTSISILPEELTGIPDAPDYVRGLANLRDSCIPVLDLRLLLNMQILSEEICMFENMMDARKKDHQNWVDELIRSIDEKTPFALTSDPHQCAFGKWYDHYKSNNPMVQFQLKKIDEPHRELHNMAVETQQVLNITDAQERERALERIQKQLKDQILPIMLHLLDDTKRVMRDSIREMMLVLDDGTKKCGLAVDEVLRVETLEPVPDTIKIDDYHQMNYVTGIAKSKEQIVLLIDEKKLLELV